jgi:hypothetical protein
MAEDTAAQELTVDELARVTGMTVRNIRSHATALRDVTRQVGRACGRELEPLRG